jgi:hypothetical protein
MRSYALAAAAAAALFVGSASQAAVTVSYTIVRGPDALAPAFVGPGAAQLNAAGGNWVGVKLTATEDTAGLVLKGFDVSGARGIFAPMHQRWVDSDFDTIFESTPTGAVTATTTGDSHLLIAANSQQGTTATEDNSGTGSPVPTDDDEQYGLGTFVKGAWALDPANYGMALDFAYLVLKADVERIINLNIAVTRGPAASSNNELVDMPNVQVVVPAIPEPASLSLLGLSALGLLRRRRA